MVTGRLKQQRVPVRWVLPPHTELQAPLKHLRKEQTPEMLPSDDDNIPADSPEGPHPPPSPVVKVGWRGYLVPRNYGGNLDCD